VAVRGSGHPARANANPLDLSSTPNGDVEPSGRVEKVVAHPPLCEMSDPQRRELHEALLGADTVEDLSGKWQAAILKAEQNRPSLRIIGSDLLRGVPRTRAPTGAGARPRSISAMASSVSPCEMGAPYRRRRDEG
jgi:hypothetical protein